MIKLWNILKNKFQNENGIFSLGFSDVSSSGLAAIFWLYIASVIEPSEYGEIHYFLSIAGMAQIISMLGNSHVLTVYTAKKEKIQSTLFLLSIIPTIVSSVIIVAIFYRIDSALLVFGYVIFESVNAVTLGRKYYRKYAKLILIQKSLTIILGMSFFYAFNTSGIIFALVLTYVPHIFIFIKEFKHTRINFSVLQQKKSFILNNYLMTFSGSFGGQIDKLILAPLLGFTLLGNYSLALQIFTILVMFSSIVFKFLLPQDSSGTNTNTIKKYTILISIGISILGVFVVPKLIPIFFIKFIDTVDVISIMSLAIIPDAITMLFMSKMLGQEKSKFVLLAKFTSLIIMVVGFILLGPIYGIMGLATVIVGTSIIQAVFLVITDKIIEGKKNIGY